MINIIHVVQSRNHFAEEEPTCCFTINVVLLSVLKSNDSFLLPPSRRVDGNYN